VGGPPRQANAQEALATAKAKGITRSEDTLLPQEVEAARAERVAAARAPFDKPALRDEIENARSEREQVIDHINLDQVTYKRFQAWIFRDNAQRGTAFTPEQTEWLRLMKEHIASSCSIGRDDFDCAELADKGGLHKAWGLFGKELDRLVGEMNVELVA
jgi:EcoEI R protein C-terminal